MKGKENLSASFSSFTFSFRFPFFPPVLVCGSRASRALFSQEDSVQLKSWKALFGFPSFHPRSQASLSLALSLAFEVCVDVPRIMNGRDTTALNFGSNSQLVFCNILCVLYCVSLKRESEPPTPRLCRYAGDVRWKYRELFYRMWKSEKWKILRRYSFRSLSSFVLTGLSFMVRIFFLFLLLLVKVHNWVLEKQLERLSSGYLPYLTKLNH